MAVIRIVFPDKKTVESFAGAMDADPELKRGAREVRRVLERYGWNAELTESEVERAFALRDGMSSAARELIEDARVRLDEMREWDAARRERAYGAAESARKRLGALKS